MSPPVLEAKPPPLVQALCPKCSYAFNIVEGSAVLPCSRCWPSMDAAERAPWIQVLRRDPGHNLHRHRDPVLYAPPTLLAYVQHLEAQLPRWVSVTEATDDMPFTVAMMSNGAFVHFQTRHGHDVFLTEDRRRTLQGGFILVTPATPSPPKVTP